MPRRNLPFLNAPVTRSPLLRLLPLVLLVAAACGGNRPPPDGVPGGPAPDAVVDKFMKLVESKEYDQMGWLFGNHGGSVYAIDEPNDVERRMYALATVLRHRSYTIGNQAQVPGRSGAAVRMNVRLVNERSTFDVPFIVVRGPEGRWFVEQVDVEAVTNAPG